jgi:hypothetical protein
MSMRKRALAALVILGAGVAPALAETGPDLGRVATPDEIASYDIDASPDGSGLPPGRGTAKQGEAVYAAQCQGCHGPKGRGGPVMALVGGLGTITSEDKRPLKTVGSYWPYATSLFAYTRRSMPFYKSKSLSIEELYSVTAYVLFLNDLVGENDVIDATTLPQVKMPNRDGFYQWKRGM